VQQKGVPPTEEKRKNRRHKVQGKTLQRVLTFLVVESVECKQSTATTSAVYSEDDKAGRMINSNDADKDIDGDEDEHDEIEKDDDDDGAV